MTDQEQETQPIQPKKYHAVKGTIICRFPISAGHKKKMSVEQRKRDKKGYRPKKDLEGWANLALDAKNNINFFITLQTKYDMYQIRISQWSLLRMIKYRLALRPIHQTKTDFYSHEAIKKIPYYDNIFNLPVEEVRKQYDRIVKHMESLVRLSEGKQKERKEAQFEDLLRREGQIDLWDCMKACEKCELDVLEEGDSDLEGV